MADRIGSSAATVVIVGGGLMGLSAAVHLRRRDAAVRVVVLERGRAGAAASGASAAGVRASWRDPAERALALASLARWPDLDRELEAPTRYRRTGGLRVGLDEASWRSVPAAAAEQRAAGVPVEILDAAATRALAPGVAPGVLGGAHCAIDGQAEAAATIAAFASAARRLGARVEEGAGARGLEVEGGRVAGVTRADGGREPCDAVIVAAGAWTAPLLAGAGVRLPVSTRALQMLLTAPAPPALTPVVGAFERPLSLKQLAGGAFLIGGGWPARIDDEAANRWTVLDDSVAGSLAVATEVYPSLAACPVADRWAGLEAFTPDLLPLLGPVPGIDGLFVATGFSGHGFALSPMVGGILARLALGRDPLAHLWTGLRADRFPPPPPGPAAPEKPSGAATAARRAAR
jgi:sarcosine oxidase subunit beta